MEQAKNHHEVEGEMGSDFLQDMSQELVLMEDMRETKGVIGSY